MATEIGKAYVQVVPTTKNIKSELESQMSGGIEEAGKSSGKKFCSCRSEYTDDYRGHG